MGLVKVGTYRTVSSTMCADLANFIGQLTLRNLRMKKGALDKFRLPVDVLEGECAHVLLTTHLNLINNRPPR